MEGMEKREKAPERYSDLHDPKLPQIHGQFCGNRAQERIKPRERA